MATLDTVTDVLDMLLRAKPATRLESFEQTVETWAMLLRNVPDGVLTQAAVMLALEPGPFVPDVGTLHGAALDLVDDQPPADEAWALVERKARGKAVDLPERAAEVVRLMGGTAGWPDDMTWQEKDFRERYAGLRARWRRQEALAVTAGEGRRLLDAG